MSEENEVATQPDLDQLTAVYIKIRDKRAELSRAFKSKDKELEEQQQLLADQMLESCKELNASSISTQHGTIIRSVKSKYWTNDWDSLYKVVKEYDAFGVLFKAINQTNMKQFLEENPDVMPMGLNVENQYEIVVRRKS